MQFQYASALMVKWISQSTSEHIFWGSIIPIKKYRFCSHGEMDITIDFGSIIEGSNPSGSTIKPFILRTSSDFDNR